MKGILKSRLLTRTKYQNCILKVKSSECSFLLKKSYFFNFFSKSCNLLGLKIEYSIESAHGRNTKAGGTKKSILELEKLNGGYDNEKLSTNFINRSCMFYLHRMRRISFAGVITHI